MRAPRLRGAFVAGLWGLALLGGITYVVRPATAAPPAAVAQAEIAQLFACLESSGCSFNRNGTWYGSPQAASHLREKLRILSSYGQIATAEAFIDKAATASSLSGQAYAVRCGTGPVISSRQWLYEALARIRACGAGCTSPAQRTPDLTAPPSD